MSFHSLVPKHPALIRYSEFAREERERLCESGRRRLPVSHSLVKSVTLTHKLPHILYAAGKLSSLSLCTTTQMISAQADRLRADVLATSSLEQ